MVPKMPSKCCYLASIKTSKNMAFAHSRCPLTLRTQLKPNDKLDCRLCDFIPAQSNEGKPLASIDAKKTHDVLPSHGISAGPTHPVSGFVLDASARHGEHEPALDRPPFVLRESQARQQNSKASHSCLSVG